MKIATWNIERLKHQRACDQILLACERVQADILVLTETDMRIHPPYQHGFQTPTPPDTRLPGCAKPLRYQPTENRVSIFTNYKCVRQYATYDPYTALCVELETERGHLLLYGTVIGIQGNRRLSFAQDLAKQAGDFRRLSTGGKHLCVCGDFNCSFADNYYFTKTGRETIRQAFSENHIRLLTDRQAACIDHIAVSEKFVDGAGIHIEEWNQDKKLSDHKGIAVSLV